MIFAISLPLAQSAFGKSDSSVTILHSAFIEMKAGGEVAAIIRVNPRSMVDEESGERMFDSAVLSSESFREEFAEMAGISNVSQSLLFAGGASPSRLGVGGHRQMSRRDRDIAKCKPQELAEKAYDSFPEIYEPGLRWLRVIGALLSLIVCAAFVNLCLSHGSRA